MPFAFSRLATPPIGLPRAQSATLRATVDIPIRGKHWTQIGENPPVGLILCTDKDVALAHYAMEGLHNKMLVREYRTALPKESAFAEEIARTRELLEHRAESRWLSRPPRR